MINTETITIRDKQFIRTYSDQNKYIERDGVQYSEAIDPIDTNRIYIETNVDIEIDGVKEVEYDVTNENI